MPAPAQSCQYPAPAAIHSVSRERWMQRAREIAADIRHETDYAYGQASHERLDIYPAARFDAPVLAFIHGGAWQPFDKSDLAFLAPAFVDAGISLVLFDHTPAPQATPSECCQQMLRAVVWLWHNACDLGIDPQRMFIGGHGAGAHLAAMLAAAHWPSYAIGLPERLLQGALCLGGLYDLAAPPLAPLRNSLRLAEDAARHVSPIHYRPQQPLTIVSAAGSLETPEGRRQNDLLAQAWPHCRIDTLTVDGVDHFGLLDTLATPGSALFKASRRMIDG